MNTDPVREHDDEQIPPPVGTLFVMMLYIMLLAGMWAAIYFQFLGM